MTQLVYIDPQSAMFVLVGILLICLFVSNIFYFNAKHKEKLLLLEKGITDVEEKKDNGNSFLKVGIVVIGLSIGLIINSFLHSYFSPVNDGISLAVMGITGGIALIIASRIGKKS